MAYTAFLILAPVSVLVLSAVLVSTQRFRRTSEIMSLRWLAACVIGWLVFNSLEVLAATPEATLFWAKVTYVFVTATPVTWVVFAARYGSTGFHPWIRTRGSWLLLLIPATTVLLTWTNDTHHLVWSRIDFVRVEGFLTLHVAYGIAFWVHIINAYALVLFGALFIARHCVIRFRSYRSQSLWLLIGALVPVVFNVVHVFDLFPALQKDYTPIGFAAAGIAFSVGMLWHRLFDLKPIARAAVVDGLDDPVMVMDQEGRVVDFNPAAGRLLSGLNAPSHPDDLIGLGLTQVLQSWPALADMVIDGAAASADLALTHDGASRVYECRTSPLLSARRHSIGRLVILRDITQRKETESALRHHMAELEASNEQLDAFAHTVAHDLKGPLSTIIGYAEMLNVYYDQLPRDEVLRHLGELEYSGQRMVSIVDALLLLSRVYREQEIPIVRVAMGEPVAEALRRVASPTTEKRARFTYPPSWPTVLGYADWIVEVWANYLTNALKYSDDAPVVELGYDPEPKVSDGTCFARFWVRDRGIGLTEDQIEKLFIPFTRFHTTYAPGHGLGLSIVRRIIERLGGEVGVESTPGEGSTFWFTLPWVRDTAADVEPIAADVVHDVEA